MSFNYQVVLFKNKVKKRIINKFKTLKKAEHFFTNLISESDKVFFPKKFENGFDCNFELSLMGKENNQQPLYIKDEMGRQIKVSLDDSNYKIIKIHNYNIEEEFLEYNVGKINSKFFLEKHLSGDGLKMLSKLNNKIVLQNDDVYKLFTFKNDLDSERFIEVLSEKLKSQNRMDCLLVKDFSNSQRKYLYEILIENGFSKSYLQRHSTTHPSKK